MLHSIRSLAIATGLAQVNGDVADLLDKVLAQHRPALDAILRKFFLAEVTPENTFNFERELAEELRKIGAQTVEDAFNALEGDQPEQLPHDVQFEGGGYRQLKDKTPNRHVATLTVYDRAGKRLGTVYLSVAPELGQHTLTARLTALIEAVYRYLQKRTRQMRYHEYRGQNLPIGSGVTEAACKTVVTQRLKLSGMRWEKANAQKILDLRVVWLSGIWGQTYRSLLTSSRVASLRTYRRLPLLPLRQAA